MQDGERKRDDVMIVFRTNGGVLPTLYMLTTDRMMASSRPRSAALISYYTLSTHSLAIGFVK